MIVNSEGIKSNIYKASIRHFGLLEESMSSIHCSWLLAHSRGSWGLFLTREYGADGGVLLSASGILKQDAVALEWSMRLGLAQGRSSRNLVSAPRSAWMISGATNSGGRMKHNNWQFLESEAPHAISETMEVFLSERAITSCR